MRAEVLSIGSELLRGDITDTNAAFLAQRLASLGYTLRRVTQVGDDASELEQVLGAALDRTALVVCTGGIGPTPDDLTREAAAAVLRESMTVDAELEKELRAYFDSRRMTMPERNLKQAMLIPSARPLGNRMGTAPGWWVERDAHIIILLPGVPYEMKAIWHEEVEPVLRGRSGNVILTRTLKTYGLGESLVAERLGTLLCGSDPAVATYAKSDGVHVMVTATARTEEDALALVEPAATAVREALRPSIWGEGDETLAGTVARDAGRLAISLAVDEEATGGALSSLLHAAGAVGAVHAAASGDGEALRLWVGPPTEHSGGRQTFSCSTGVQASDRSETRQITASSLPALADRASTAALLLALEALRRRDRAAPRPT